MVRPLTPKDFAQSFHDLFFTSAHECGETEIGINWSKRVDNDTEWTAVMAVFLSRLARSLGFYQEWEYGKDEFDHAWFGDSPWSGPDDLRSPDILIEHENDVTGVIESEVPKLAESKCSELSRFGTV